MPRLAGIAPVLIVPEVAQALDWYRDRLGFDVRTWEPAPATYGYAQRDQIVIHVAQGEQPRPNHEVVQPDLFDVYIRVDDVDGLYAEFEERGASILHAPVERPWQAREIRVQDPFGYILAFGEPL